MNPSPPSQPDRTTALLEQLVSRMEKLQTEVSTQQYQSTAPHQQRQPSRATPLPDPLSATFAGKSGGRLSATAADKRVITRVVVLAPPLLHNRPRETSIPQRRWPGVRGLFPDGHQYVQHFPAQYTHRIYYPGHCVRHRCYIPVRHWCSCEPAAIRHMATSKAS